MTNNDTREVAWQSWDEWKYVRNMLYSFGDPASIQKGISFVSVWRCRLRQGALPISVELTACLADSYLASIFQNEQNVGQVHLSIAMSLVRFVNGITDQLQTGLYAQSVQLIADKMNIPDWMVDIRHQATHSQLPSLELLKDGLTYALSWLQENYWDETVKALEIKEQERLLKINEIVMSYGGYVFSTLSTDKISVKGKKKKQKNRDSEKSNEITQGLLKLVNASNMKNFISVLCHAGHGFVMDNDQMTLVGISHLITNDDFQSLFELLLVISDKWKSIFCKFIQCFPTFGKQVFLALSYSLQENNVIQYNLIVSMYLLYKIVPELVDDIIQCLLQNPSFFSFQVISKMTNELNLCKPYVDWVVKIFTPIGDVLTKRPLTKNMDLHLTDIFTKNVQLLKNNEIQKNIFQSEKLERKRWKLVGKEVFKALPPMGEFKNGSFLNFDVNRQGGTCWIHKTFDETEIDSTQAENQESQEIMNGLFLDCNNGISNLTSSEYQLELDSSSVDFDIVDEGVVEEDGQIERINNCGKYNIDLSKISFF